MIIKQIGDTILEKVELNGVEVFTTRNIKDKRTLQERIREYEQGVENERKAKYE